MSMSQKLFVRISANADDLTRAFRRGGEEVGRFTDKLRQSGKQSYFGRLIGDLKQVRQESRAAWQQMSALEKTQHRMRQVGAAVTSTAAAAWVLKEPAKRQMDYDLRLRHMSNTAYAGESLEKRRAGVETLRQATTDAVRRYGGNLDDAASALDTIVASGILKADKATKALPEIQKYATAFDAQTQDLAAIAISGVQNMQISPDNIGKMYEMAGKAGQEGGFELKDMARWLPTQTAAAKGMSGEKGFARLVAMNQAARFTAGSADEAGNNVVNLLTKMNSNDTIGALKKKFDIDLNVEYEKGMREGKDTSQVFVDTISSIVNRDPQFKKAMQMAQTADANGDKSAETWANIANVVEGSAIGQIVNDRQASAALTGIMGKQDYVEKVYKNSLDANGIGDDNFALVSESNSFKAQQFTNEKDIKTQQAFEPFNNALGTAAEKVVAFSQAFPETSTAITGAGWAATALGAAGLGGGLFLKGFPGLGGGAAGTGGLGATTSGIASSASGWLMNILSKVFTKAGGFGAGLLFHSEGLNTGENDKVWQMHIENAKTRGMDPKQYLTGGQSDVMTQTGEAINRAGDAAALSLKTVGEVMGNNNQAISQALIAQVGQTKIQGNIAINVSAAAGLLVQTAASGNENTKLNLGPAGVGGK